MFSDPSIVALWVMDCLINYGCTCDVQSMKCASKTLEVEESWAALKVWERIGMSLNLLWFLSRCVVA